RVAKTEPADILKGRRPSESVDEVNLLTLQNRLLGTSGRDGLANRGRVVFQVRIERASEPHRVLSQHVLLHLPHSVNAILHNVGRSALVAFAERGEDGILLYAPPGVAKLHVVLFGRLAEAEVQPIGFILL